ncbi:hypothetical protein C7974DRAFT_309785 [Boeremia exigua]|uniref:uncharacterized protein n=1 Tax=Boeremia exigua TaxID=749465 RepID=UPI001E8EC299|nr:uncharacterized protein C7974DRAFT_309785 [Boeremia exigua]KAH6633535.1 hypothetical protein C7974DRAFT_309785 [Boeremia exigua]
MGSSTAFSIGIAVHEFEKAKFVTDRVVLDRQTCVLYEDTQTVPDREKKCQYRYSFFQRLRSACGERQDAERLLEAFVGMADGLHTSKAICFNIAADKHVDLADAKDEQDTDTQSDPLCDVSSNHALLHPLSIALLAYHMGGAVNAANTIHTNEWRSRTMGADDMPDFYQEGDLGDIFDDYRVSLVWEKHNSVWINPSGTHTVFRKGASVPQSLTTLSAASKGEQTGPIVVLYATSNAALWYDCKDTTAVRRSISLDFHVNTITDQDPEILSTPDVSVHKIKNPTLAQLVTRFPVKGYNKTFHRLLFADDSIQRALDKLASLVIPLPLPQSPSSKNNVHHRYRVWWKSNLDSVSAAPRPMPSIPISGVYDDLTAFVNCLSFNAHRDIYLEVGMDLLPRSPADADSEYAWRSIRDQPGLYIFRKLFEYERHLTMPYTGADLQSTIQICRIGRWVRDVCSQLISAGYTEGFSLLSAIGSLSASLGDAMNGLKQADVTLEPWVTDMDLDAFRVKSLCLFWCADWLARYLMNPQKGSMMVYEFQGGAMVSLREEAAQTARVLLRNWVAWSLLVDRLPKGGFTVQMPTDLRV